MMVRILFYLHMPKNIYSNSPVALLVSMSDIFYLLPELISYITILLIT